MHIYPRTEAGMTAALIAIPLVGLFVWIFNSYRLGKFNRFIKPKQSAENIGIERNGRYRTWIVCGIIVVVLIAALGIFASGPIVSCKIEVPENYLEAIESQSKGVYSTTLPLVPVYTSVDSYSDGIVHYTIHYFPFGTVGMSYIEGDGYNIEKPLTGL